MVSQFTQKINYLHLTKVNHTRVKLKGLDTVNQKPKLYARKPAHTWGIVIERAKKIIMATTQNSVWGVTIPLTKRFWTRKEMFIHQWLSGTTYTNTMIAGIKSVSVDRVAHVYVTDFGEIRIYYLAHRRESHTLL